MVKRKHKVLKRQVFDVISRDRKTGKKEIVKTFNDESVAKDFAKWQRSSEKYYGVRHGKSEYNRTYQTKGRIIGKSAVQQHRTNKRRKKRNMVLDSAT